MEILSTYPPAVLDRAISPSRGVPAFITYPNLAKFKELLDEWNTLFWEEHAKTRAAQIAKQKPEIRRSTPGGMVDPPPGHFANVHIPDSHPRYQRLCEWAKAAEPKWWKYGHSSEGVVGIWVPLSIWLEGVLAIEKVKAAMPTIGSLVEHYRKHDLAFRPKNAQPINVNTRAEENVDELTDRDCC